MEKGRLALAGLLVVAAAGLGGAFLYFRPQTTQWTSSPPTIPDTAAPEQPEASAKPPKPAQTGFQTDSTPYTLITNAVVYVAPSRDAPQMYVLPQGTKFMSVGKLDPPPGASESDGWILAVTGNGIAANIQRKDVGPFDENAQANGDVEKPASREPIAGDAEVIDSATLRVAGQTVPLFGVIGASGEAADRLQKSFVDFGAAVSCQPNGQTYICYYKGGKGNDIARTELFSGNVKAAPDATTDYFNLEAAAQRAHKGIWLTAGKT